MSAQGPEREAPERDDIERLARKYRVLGDLRRARARGEEVPAREVFRDLAGEFPGALLELDTLPLPEIDQRAEALEAAANGRGPIEPWMEWLHAYHTLLRAALYIKRHVRRGEDLTRDRAAALSGQARAKVRSSAAVDEVFAMQVARPPGGRMNTLVIDRLAMMFETDARSIRHTLFPGLRSRVR